MGGLRFDYNFYYNMLFWTPRLHLKWVPYRDGLFVFPQEKDIERPMY